MFLLFSGQNRLRTTGEIWKFSKNLFGFGKCLLMVVYELDADVAVDFVFHGGGGLAAEMAVFEKAD